MDRPRESRMEKNSLEVASRIDERDSMELDLVQRVAQAVEVFPFGKKHSSEYAFLDWISDRHE